MSGLTATQVRLLRRLQQGWSVQTYAGEVEVRDPHGHQVGTTVIMKTVSRLIQRSLLEEAEVRPQKSRYVGVDPIPIQHYRLTELGRQFR